MQGWMPTCLDKLSGSLHHFALLQAFLPSLCGFVTHMRKFSIPDDMQTHCAIVSVEQLRNIGGQRIEA